MIKYTIYEISTGRIRGSGICDQESDIPTPKAGRSILVGKNQMGKGKFKVRNGKVEKQDGRG